MSLELIRRSTEPYGSPTLLFWYVWYRLISSVITTTTTTTLPPLAIQLQVYSDMSDIFAGLLLALAVGLNVLKPHIKYLECTTLSHNEFTASTTCTLCILSVLWMTSSWGIDNSCMLAGTPPHDDDDERNWVLPVGQQQLLLLLILLLLGSTSRSQRLPSYFVSGSVAR